MEAAERLADLEDPALALTTLRSLLRDASLLRAGARARRPAQRRRGAAPGARWPAARWGTRAAGLAEAAGETREALRLNANRLLSMDVLLDRLAG